MQNQGPFEVLWSSVCVTEESQVVKWETAHGVGAGTVLILKPVCQVFAVTHAAVGKLGSLGTDRVVVRTK